MNKKPNTAIIINPYCCQGQGWKKWLRVKEEIYKLLPASTKEFVLENGVELPELLDNLLPTATKTILISAGGDGSHNHLINYLMHLPKAQLDAVSLGTIGLGSSNDFLKPFNNKIVNVPVNINYTKGSFLHDVGVCNYIDEDGRRDEKYFIVNASFGVTAEANWKFNHPGSVLRSLKKMNIGAAIIYTALSTIFQHKNVSCTIKYYYKKMNACISNINILKIPYVSGNLFYKQKIERNDGRLSLNACFNMSSVELLTVLKRLGKGEFKITEKTISTLINEFQMEALTPFVFEYDGETAKTTSIHISILPKAIKILNQ
jgi:diacylglycerol kinase (ATP)